MNHSILSVGIAIRALLKKSPTLAKRCTKIFPVVVDEAKLPYILYRRAEVHASAVKLPARPPRRATIEVVVYAETYAESIALAEAVDDALSGNTYEGKELAVREIALTNAAEDYADGAYMQALTFDIAV